ncbi:unnamed protein product [Microthlaspi erraticum]|uniref:Uncharacterized protein n=1 Tax=Microthlaspi erraticum TaxID=1685480 RepID=A0A6D2IBI2_9BRAS|nr:unnamed protein product [Microthlaspi erraticum]
MQGSDSEIDTESEFVSSQHSTVTTTVSALPKTKCKRLSEEATTTSVTTKWAKQVWHLLPKDQGSPSQQHPKQYEKQGKSGELQ